MPSLLPLSELSGPEPEPSGPSVMPVAPISSAPEPESPQADMAIAIGAVANTISKMVER
ncbi:MAG: hypothetical protein HC873_20965 [Leptolyngbyaceae cyanobacterium SL_1_1]|nr:hypothetical protein [Leptolyngbyaceae cyanobacterium SL_1_1]